MSEATLVPTKIGPVHLGRDAYVYVRQSTLTQVREHGESLARQYELRERAVALGWDAHQVRVIDADLGRSGAETTAREGFKELVADVGLGRVGIIFGIEVSRLARNNADWYQLLDLCALTNTLIADSDGVYHPGEFNDRLVLGLKGTMSEAELHLIRSRLTAGLRHKAARGELRQGLPVGFDYDEDGRVVICTDEAAVEAIATVFRRFADLGSARQVLVSLREDGLLLPRRPTRTGRISWAATTYPAVHDFLTNPCYAGAFVFGRSRSEKRIDLHGRVITRTVAVPREEWAVLIPEHHRGFIDWPTFEANTAKLRGNWRPPRGTGGGAAREGAALLQGRIRCGRCGRMMQTGYSGTKGNCPRYLCARAKQLYGGEKGCQSLGGRRLEQRVLAEVFAVLAPAALEATIQALRDAETAHATTLKAFTLAVERARFEADRARRQYDVVEPENRLVARTLERALESKLAAQRQAERDLLTQQARRPVRLTDDELSWLNRAGADVRPIFEAPTTTFRDRKQLLRAILTEVVVTIDDDKRTAAVTITWQGGASTDLTLTMNKTGGHARATDEDTVALVQRLAAHYDDTTIAMILGRQRRRTGTGLSFTKTRVKSLRVARGIPAYQPPENVGPLEQDAVVVSISEAERLLGVGKVTLYRWLADGFLIGEQLTLGSPWRIRIDQAVRERLAPQVPDGWLKLADAARVLGIARQTVLHKVQRGEFEAVHVNQGRRKGLRINVHGHQAELFDQP
ncbi:MAG: recombinase family protein [Ornithinimicrobium sp.]|uniref:recombinase family protein n=1 Tax=Ornithinimicrobium sp. TaxID=1977084 RepID=UPI003D9AEB10